MADDDWDGREARIIEAAYALLAERGYAATSMLSVAKAAKVSNETLYKRYGDKRGLFGRMVEANAAFVRKALEEAAAHGAGPLKSLEAVARVLLGMLLGERAISLNRAAAADETGELGAALAVNGRDAVMPLIVSLLQQALDLGAIRAPSARQAAEWYVALLVGDLQIRRVNRVFEVPSADEIEKRAQTSFAAFSVLCAAR